MRGKAIDIGPIHGELGITPAYAGKRGGFHRQLSRVKDHPRVCGEKQVASRQTTTHLGSPPRMRGKAAGVYAYSDSERITPAYAGKSFFCPDRILWDRDHPRVCGEKLYMPCAIAPNVGSPPRMRGKGKNVNRTRRTAGITPAYAGKRLKRFRSTVSPVAIVPLFPSVCNKPVVSDGSPAGRDAPLFLPAENAVPASPAYNLRSL